MDMIPSRVILSLGLHKNIVLFGMVWNVLRLGSQVVTDVVPLIYAIKLSKKSNPSRCKFHV